MGCPYVIVNGTIVVDQGEVLSVKPGKPIRFAVQSKGRFEPVDVSKWLDAHTISGPPSSQVDDTGAAELVRKR